MASDDLTPEQAIAFERYKAAYPPRVSHSMTAWYHPPEDVKNIIRLCLPAGSESATLEKEAIESLESADLASDEEMERRAAIADHAIKALSRKKPPTCGVCNDTGVRQAPHACIHYGPAKPTPGDAVLVKMEYVGDGFEGRCVVRGVTDRNADVLTGDVHPIAPEPTTLNPGDHALVECVVHQRQPSGAAIVGHPESHDNDFLPSTDDGSRWLVWPKHIHPMPKAKNS